MRKCLNRLCPEIIEANIDPGKAAEYIFRKSSEVYEMPERYTIKGINIPGAPPLYAGLLKKKKEILFYFTKPCFGTALAKVKGSEEDFKSIKEQGHQVTGIRAGDGS